MTNHCDKHKRYAPKCKACQDAKKKNESGEHSPSNGRMVVDPYQNASNPYVGQPQKRRQPYDEATKRFLFDGRLYERVLVPHANFRIIEHYFIDADEWGYEHFTSIPNGMRAEVILIFKRKV